MEYSGHANKIRTRLTWLVIATLLIGNLAAQTNMAPAPVPESENVVKLDLQLKSKDRMFQGAIKIPDSWTHVSLRFVNTTTSQVLGTYPDILENLTSAKPSVKIYNHKDDIFSDQDVKDAKTDPAITEQKVVFYKDDSDPKLLHFSSIFDAVGLIQIQVIQGGKEIVYGEARLTPDAEFSSLIESTDKTISGPTGTTTNAPGAK